MDILQEPPVRAAFRGLRLLVAAYVAVSLLTLVAAFLMRGDHDLVTPTVWVRGVIVAAASLLMLAFVTGTARGHRPAYLRLRIASAAMVAAVVVLVSLPGFLPLWMRIEQGGCGLLLIGVVAIANAGRLRRLFASRPAERG
ncbi:hypothetical protein J5X84_40540 [Streptosporangiaceae bacterium NEAU-GS5]|nr:hypothetical protein [Streptosporangiaceae bacterium NEAU-GS5]